jgi:enoyl-CoA hydratase
MPSVLCDVVDRVATVTLHDPKRRNTISLDMNAEIVACIDALEARDDVGAIVLTGTAPAFCAGADLEDLRTCAGADTLGRIYEGFLRIAHCSLPTVAAVNGAAVGAGMNMALACDVILAARSARFDTRFLQIGIHPGGGHTWRLRRITDQQTVMAMVLFGEQLDGDAAERVGLAWRCLDDDALLDGARALAARAAHAPRELVARTKATILSLAGIDTSEAAVAHELTPQVWSMGQPAFQQLLGSLQQQLGKG